jgi:hypothetical protein
MEQATTHFLNAFTDGECFHGFYHNIVTPDIATHEDFNIAA